MFSSKNKKRARKELQDIQRNLSQEKKMVMARSKETDGSRSRQTGENEPGQKTRKRC
jgi:hypothetical protein